MKPLFWEHRLSAAISWWPDGQKVWINASDLSAEACIKLAEWLKEAAMVISLGEE